MLFRVASRRISAAVKVLLRLTGAFLVSLLAFLRSRAQQSVVELALRQQLAVYPQARPRLTSLDRAFWLVLRRPWPRWKEMLVVVRPETVVRWHRKGFRFYWRPLSRPGPGRPRIPREVRNHKDGIAAVDFFVVPTVRFQLLYVWFVIDHARRRLIHFNVTPSPTALWVIQQLREAFPYDRAPRYLVYDRDSIFSREVTGAIRSFRTEPRPAPGATPGGLLRLGGLHHRYIWQQAA